ncbi:MAG: GntR family transcriptional regulator [Lentisphaerae bacterium]|nr:GntR family transcriptional regulator [Lentisphaerota bacterium]
MVYITRTIIRGLMMKESAFSKIKDNLQCFNRPIYETVIVTLTEMIKSGELPPGTKFPPDKKLAIELGISHITLAKALNELRRRNILDRRRASGTTVPEHQILPEASKSRKKIAVVFDFASEETFQQQLFLQLFHGLNKLNCSLCFFSADDDPDKQMSILEEILNDFSISGCLVWSILSPEQAARIIRLRPRCYPLIFMDKHYEGFDHDAVTYPNFACGAAIATSLNRRKITSCCYLEKDGQEFVPSDIDRREGFLSMWKPENKFVRLTLPSQAGTLQNLPKNTALVCSDYLTALQLKNILENSGISNRKNVFVIESPTDDHSLIPGFNAYKFSPTIGEETIKILSSRLNGKECCTVSHSGKWSVLGAKSTNKGRKKNEPKTTTFVPEVRNKAHGLHLD